MRLLALGDIHGCVTALETLLSSLNLQKGDQLVSLGDYVNKGPDSRATLDRLIQLFDQDLLIPLKGNHELKLLTAGQLQQPQTQGELLLDTHTLNSYGSTHGPGGLEDIPEAHWRFVSHHCQDWLETEQHIFVHATPLADRAMADQTPQGLFYEKFHHPLPHISGKVLICGHTPQRNGLPLNLGHAICLDTAACEGQWLTCLDVLTGELWQANQNRQLRYFPKAPLGNIPPGNPNPHFS